MKMSNVQHLYTPLVGDLTRDTGVLVLADLLHPTPAVGGVPRDASLERIRAHEPFDRGWYAGPIGWLDAREDGDFAVAIRSALICGERAFLHAGCGIVAESDVQRELAESVLKLQPVLRILRGSKSKP
jgi:isochorismate synthase EntC